MYLHCSNLFSSVEQRSPTIYIGGGQEFLSEIGLFRRLPGTELFASRVKSGSTIELGENVQLRSIVRSGDGNYLASNTVGYKCIMCVRVVALLPQRLKSAFKKKSFALACFAEFSLRS